MPRFNEFKPNSLDVKGYYKEKMLNIKDEFKINNLDELAEEVVRITNDWHRVVNVDEGDLREREMLVYEALLRLKPDQGWKNKNVDIFVNYIKAADDLNVIEFVKKEFDLQQIPIGGLAAKNVLDNINRNRQTNIAEESIPGVILDNEDITEKTKKDSMPN